MTLGICILLLVLPLAYADNDTYRYYRIQPDGNGGYEIINETRYYNEVYEEQIPQEYEHLTLTQYKIFLQTGIDPKKATFTEIFNNTNPYGSKSGNMQIMGDLQCTPSCATNYDLTGSLSCDSTECHQTCTRTAGCYGTWRFSDSCSYDQAYFPDNPSCDGQEIDCQADTEGSDKCYKYVHYGAFSAGNVAVDTSCSSISIPWEFDMDIDRTEYGDDYYEEDGYLGEDQVGSHCQFLGSHSTTETVYAYPMDSGESNDLGEVTSSSYSYEEFDVFTDTCYSSMHLYDTANVYYKSWLTADSYTADCTRPQCDEGTCCNIGAGLFKSSGTVCQPAAEPEYGCPYGTDLGSDVGIRYKDYLCTGTSSDCTGTNYQWTDWSIDHTCSSIEICSEGSCSEQNFPPSFNQEPTDDSSAGSPTNIGNSITFTAEIADVNTNEQVRLVICDNQGISSGSCSGTTYCSSDSGSPGQKQCTFSTSGVNSEVLTWRGYACDDENACTAASNTDTFHVNHPPTVDKPTITGSPYANALLTCNTAAHDQDSNDAPNITAYRWYVDNAEIANQISITFDCGAVPQCSKHKAVQCSAVAKDMHELQSSYSEKSNNFNILNKPPNFESTTQDDSTQENPTVEGQVVTFTTNIQDLDNDQVKFLVCNSGLSGTSCSGKEYCSVGFNSPGEKECTYPTAGLLGESYNWRSFACDNDNGCTEGMSGTFYVNLIRPTNASIFLVNEEIWHYSDKFKGSATISNFKDEINTLLEDCTPDEDGYCIIPFTITSESDGVLNFDSLNLNFEIINDPPIVYPIEDIFTYSGQTIDLTVLAYDPDDWNLDYDISEPVGDDGIWEITQEQSGNYPVTVSVSDGINTAQQTVNIHVLPVTCFEDSDCNQIVLAPQKYCDGNSVHEKTRANVCNLPSQPDSYCAVDSIDIFIEECEHSCYQGQCQEAIVCQVDADCGTSKFIGQPYCQDGELWQDYQEFDCQNNGAYCSNETIAQVIQNCVFGCENAGCLAESTEPSNVTSEQSISCSDSDGVDFFRRGTTNTDSDYCLNNSTVVEYSCQNNQVFSSQYTCQYGCLNGACQTGASQEPTVEAPEFTALSPDTTQVILNEGQSQHFEAWGDNIERYEWYLDGRMQSTSAYFNYYAAYNDAGTHKLKVVLKNGYRKTSHTWTITVNPVTVEQKPDLEITQFNLNYPPNPKINSLAMFRFVIKNTGSVKANKITWQLDTGEEKIFNKDTVDLEVGGVVYAFADTYYNSAGNYTPTLTVDYQNTIEEIDENNNQQSISVAIGG